MYVEGRDEIVRPRSAAKAAMILLKPFAMILTHANPGLTNPYASLE
jgi:hypothetical protein